MSYPRHPAARPTPGPVSRVDTGAWTVRKAGLPGAAIRTENQPRRRYEATVLLPGEGLVDVSRVAPALPAFDAAVSALARGTIMATRDGPVAIEDLLPGIEVETRDAGFQTLLWIGTTTLPAHGQPGAAPTRLFRVPAESFGPARPMPDLVLAPHARLLHRSPRLAGIASDNAALLPVAAFEDGSNVVRVAPASPVRVYHLAFSRHHILRANGIEIESYHPGDSLHQQLTEDSLRLFLSLFPHIRRLSDFGPLRVPRLTIEEFETLTAA